MEPTTLALAVDGRRWLRVPRSGGRAESPSLPAIEEIYREHAPRFRRVAQAIVHDAETAEDAVQEAFASAILRRTSFRGSGDPAAWVWRIVVNTALSRQRRRRLEALVLERAGLAPEAGAEPAASDGPLHGTLLDARGGRTDRLVRLAQQGTASARARDAAHAEGRSCRLTRDRARAGHDRLRTPGARDALAAAVGPRHPRALVPRPRQPSGCAARQRVARRRWHAAAAVWSVRQPSI